MQQLLIWSGSNKMGLAAQSSIQHQYNMNQKEESIVCM